MIDPTLSSLWGKSWSALPESPLFPQEKQEGAGVGQRLRGNGRMERGLTVLIMSPHYEIDGGSGTDGFDQRERTIAA